MEHGGSLGPGTCRSWDLSPFPPSSCILGLWHSLPFPAPQFLLDLHHLLSASITPVHHCFHWEPPGSCPVDLGVFSAMGTWVFPKILGAAAAAPWTGGVSGTCCFRHWAWITFFFKYGKGRAGHVRTFFLTCKNLILPFSFFPFSSPI